MGVMNLLKANWSGKVGQTVGAKWKNKSTIRTYTKPSNPKTAAQMLVRKGFKEVSSFVALFTDQIKALSALNTRGMSVRNSIIKLNADMVAAGEIDETALLISRGGLPAPVIGTITATPSGNSMTAAWTPVTGATISTKALFVFVAVDKANNFAAVGSALNSAGTLTITTRLPAFDELHCYGYIIDFRGSAKVGSMSVYKAA